jgi:hypothetical protein
VECETYLAVGIREKMLRARFRQLMAARVSRVRACVRRVSCMHGVGGCEVVIRCTCVELGHFLGHAAHLVFEHAHGDVTGPEDFTLTLQRLCHEPCGIFVVSAPRTTPHSLSECELSLIVTARASRTAV